MNKNIIFNLITVAFLGLALLSVVFAVIDLIENPNNAFNQKYDMTCEFKLENPVLQEVKIKDQVQCYYTKSKLDFPFSLWIFDSGTIKLEAQNKVIWDSYKNIVEFTSHDFKLTLTRLDAGTTPVTLTIYDELGKQLDQKTINVNIGAE